MIPIFWTKLEKFIVLGEVVADPTKMEDLLHVVVVHHR